MQHCRAITRQSASNLAQALILLPPAVRADMAALYAFCRQVDDVADADSLPVAERRARLTLWREDVRRACAGQPPSLPVNRELQPVIQRHRLPFGLFDELIRGCEMDLEIARYESWEELEQYCYRVAAVVGLLSIEIFGYRHPRCREYARALGLALQLTNILRDVRADAERGRIYLPLAELRRCRVTEQEILRHEYSERFGELAAGVAARARGLYRRAREILPPEDRPAMIAAELMGAVYWRLLRKLERRRFNVFAPRPVRLSAPHKLWLVLRAWQRRVCGVAVSDYGWP